MRRSPILAAACLLSACLATISCAARGTPSAGNGEVLFAIQPGDTAKGVVTKLADQRLISNKLFFLLRLRLSGVDKRLKAGTYRFATGEGSTSVFEALAEGKLATARLTIPEGATLSAIAEAADREGVATKAEVLAAARDSELLAKYAIPASSFEGYLFPDTYFLSLGAGGKFVVETMAKRFFQKVEEFAPGLGQDPKTLYADLVLASIVEREYRQATEAPLIASVFANRLKIGMALQSCATVVYVLTEHLGRPHPKAVSYADLAIDDPYNTYRHPGLPPGPISNPGETALRAVFSKTKSGYLYFRLSDEAMGTHRFSKTFEEHKETSFPVKGP